VRPLTEGLGVAVAAGSGAHGGVCRRGRLTLYLTGRGQDLGLTLVAVGRTFGTGQQGRPRPEVAPRAARRSGGSTVLLRERLHLRRPITQRQFRRRRTYGNVRLTERVWFLQVGVQEPS